MLSPEPRLVFTASVEEGPCPLEVTFDLHVIGPPGFEDNFTLFSDGQPCGMYPVKAAQWPHTVRFRAPGPYRVWVAVLAPGSSFPFSGEPLLYEERMIRVLFPTDPDYEVPDKPWCDGRSWWEYHGLPSKPDEIWF